MRCDLGSTLPFPEASFDVVYHSNVLEHIRPEQARSFVGECHRVLKRGGIVRVAVPDLEQICQLYLQKLARAIAKEENGAAEYDWIMMELLDQCVREQSGGEMLKYLRQHPLVAENFVIERIGNEGRQILSQIRSDASVSYAQRNSISWRTRLRAVRAWLVERLLGNEALKAIGIGRFRLAGEVHHWMYDRFSLSRLLMSVGFVSPEVVLPGVSRIPNWEQYGLEVGPDGAIHKPDSLVMESTKAT